MTNPDRVPLPYPATLSDLFRVKGKAELIADRVVCHPLMGLAPARAKLAIASSLHRYANLHPGTEVFGCVVYAIPRLPNGRQSFCPDVSFHAGPWPTDPMSWIEGAPVFAVEIRVLEDYETDTADARAEKRADYFAAGTQVVWDVDTMGEMVSKYCASEPLTRSCPAVGTRPTPNPPCPAGV